MVGKHLDDIIPIIVANLQPEKDPELRLKFFSLLSRLVLAAPTTLDSENHFGEFAVTVARDMILPNCVWKAGRTASAIRATAISCMWALLQSGVLTKEKVGLHVKTRVILDILAFCNVSPVFLFTLAFSAHKSEFMKWAQVLRYHSFHYI